MLSIKNQLNTPIERGISKELPKWIEKYSRETTAKLPLQYIHLLFNWMHSLERAHYKTQQFPTESNYERRLDRVLLFIEFSRQESHKDGALLMSIWRWQFGAAEVLLLCRRWRIAIADERKRILGKLRHPDVVFLKQILSLRSLLERDGIAVTEDNTVAAWDAFKAMKGKPLGKKAIDNFRNKYRKFESIFIERMRLEQAWISSPTGRSVGTGEQQRR